MMHHQITTFLMVAEQGSLKGAAEALFLSPAAVMKQMNSLESRVGVKLLERTNHGVILTPAGESFYGDAKGLAAASREAVRRARALGDLQDRTIRVGTSLLRPCKPLLNLWSQVGEAGRGFQIRIVPFSDDPARLDGLMTSLGEEIDCFVGPCGAAPWTRANNVYLLGSNPCCVAVPRGHRLAGKERLCWEDLEGETFLLIRPGQSPVLDRMRQEMIDRQPGVTIVDAPHFYDAGVFNRCQENNWLMETLDVWAEVHPGMVTLPMDWTYEMPFGVVYPKEPRQGVADFIDLLRRTRECPDDDGSPP